VIVAIAWLWYRPLVSILVLAVAGAIVFGVKRMAARRRAGPSAAAASV
jgi:hypothetical protein